MNTPTPSARGYSVHCDACKWDGWSTVMSLARAALLKHQRSCKPWKQRR